jgi:hypothetical protein
MQTKTSAMRMDAALPAETVLAKEFRPESQAPFGRKVVKTAIAPWSDNNPCITDPNNLSFLSYNDAEPYAPLSHRSSQLTKHPNTVTDLKGMAGKAKDITVTKITHIRDHTTSIPMQKTKLNPYTGAPPPALRQRPPPPLKKSSELYGPPPPRPGGGAGPSTDASTGPPTPNASSRPAAPAPPRARLAPASRSGISRPREPQEESYASPATDAQQLIWSNLSQEDKEAFFAWLDEFFARYTERMRDGSGSGPSLPSESLAPVRDII